MTTITTTESNSQIFLNDSTNLSLTLVAKKELTETELNTMRSILTQNGITIIGIIGESIDIAGTSKSICDFFKIKMLQTNDDILNIQYHSTCEPTIPETINFIGDVIGLANDVSMNNYHCEVLRQVSPRSITQKATTSYLSYFTPLQLAKLYNFPKVSGTGQTIGIIELGGGYNMSDMTTYFKYLGIPIPNIISVSVDGAVNNPSDTSGANYEVVLDIQVAGAIAYTSKIVVYFAPNTFKGFYDAINTAINDRVNNPSIISISWGSPEKNFGTTNLNSYNSLFANAVAKNINIYVASGDNGSSDGSSGLNVDFPSSSPNVIACGGTTLTSNGITITREVSWFNSASSATGGGFSSLFAKPTYQNGISAIKTKRGSPDICAVADPSTGYIVYVGGKYYSIGGTSAVAPLWSGLNALVNQSTGQNISYINPTLYSKKVCNDIVSGKNGYYTAVVGWDCCTGMGSPNGVAITNALTPAKVIVKKEQEKKVYLYRTNKLYRY